MEESAVLHHCRALTIYALPRGAVTATTKLPFFILRPDAMLQGLNVAWCAASQAAYLGGAAYRRSSRPYPDVSRKKRPVGRLSQALDGSVGFGGGGAACVTCGWGVGAAMAFLPCCSGSS